MTKVEQKRDLQTHLLMRMFCIVRHLHAYSSLCLASHPHEQQWYTFWQVFKN